MLRIDTHHWSGLTEPSRQSLPPFKINRNGNHHNHKCKSTDATHSTAKAAQEAMGSSGISHPIAPRCTCTCTPHKVFCRYGPAGRIYSTKKLPCGNVFIPQYHTNADDTFIIGFFTREIKHNEQCKPPALEAAFTAPSPSSQFSEQSDKGEG